MEFKIVVFNAARDGKLRRLKVFLDHRPKEEVDILVSAHTNGATPLVMAARNGHLQVTEYLMEKCNAKIEQVGSVTFDGETIEGAPPLWCAAAAGHLNVVKSLVSHGACVNSTTLTNSTPLRAACFDGHIDIVKFLMQHNADVEIANKHGHTCLMIACYKGHLKIARFLLLSGADVNRKSVKGNTALHDCAESGSLDIMKELLRFGAKMDVDSYGMTPLLTAAVTGHTPIVEYLITLQICEIAEKVEALELLGATYVDKKRDMMAALTFWRRATEERHKHCGLLKTKANCPLPISAYENATEFTSLQELNDLMSDPDEMRMQALLVRERILGPAHPDTSYYIRYRGAVYADTGSFDRCIRLWMYALDMQQKILEPLSPMTQSSLLSFAELFSFMISETWTRSRRVQAVSFKDLIAVFHRALREIETAMQHHHLTSPPERDSSNFHRTLVIVMHLVALLCRLQGLTPKEEDEFKRSVYRLVQLNPRARNNWTLLHLACFRDSSSVGRYPICNFPSWEVVKLLLEVGALPDDLDIDHNTALHITAMNKPCTTAVFKILLYHGAHLDLRNLEGKTPLQLIDTLPDIQPLNFMTLKCLCSQAIMRINIPYKGLVPQSLEAFIEAH